MAHTPPFEWFEENLSSQYLPSNQIGTTKERALDGADKIRRNNLEGNVSFINGKDIDTNNISPKVKATRLCIICGSPKGKIKYRGSRT